VTATGDRRLGIWFELRDDDVRSGIIIRRIPDISPALLAARNARSLSPGYALLPDILTADISASSKSCFRVKLRLALASRPIWRFAFSCYLDMSCLSVLWRGWMDMTREKREIHVIE
jgi:hypothetical protein